MSDKQEEALLQLNVLVLLKEVVNLKGAGIKNYLIPGGEATVREAVEQGLIKIAHLVDGKVYYFQLTPSGVREYTDYWTDEPSDALAGMRIAD